MCQHQRCFKHCEDCCLVWNKLKPLCQMKATPPPILPQANKLDIDFDFDFEQFLTCSSSIMAELSGWEMMCRSRYKMCCCAISEMDLTELLAPLLADSAPGRPLRTRLAAPRVDGRCWASSCNQGKMVKGKLRLNE
jgi:hypothetical protein